MLPRVSSYGKYSLNNYSVHALRFDVGDMSFWFSYDTLVAFYANGEKHTIKNYWGAQQENI